MKIIFAFVFPILLAAAQDSEIEVSRPSPRILNTVSTKLLNTSEITELVNGTKGAVISQFNLEDRGRELPTSVELRIGSQLSGHVGEPARMYFEVRNNRQAGTPYAFYVHDTYNFVVSVNPTSAFVAPGGTTVVTVILRANSGDTFSKADTVTFVAEWMLFERVTKEAYFYVGTQDSDSWSPDIWYSFTGDCAGSLTPDTCETRRWGAEIKIQDTNSGVLKIETEPPGLILRKEFIAGTRDEIQGTYSASCCNTKLLVEATDVLGNKYSRIIDIERKWLSAGEISCIVLGVILLLIIIALIIYGIVVCVRKKNTTLNIYPNN